MMTNEDIIKELGKMGDTFAQFVKLLKEGDEDTEHVSGHYIEKEINTYIDYIDLAIEMGSLHIDYQIIYPKTAQFFRDLGYIVDTENKQIKWDNPQEQADFKMWPFPPEYYICKLHSADQAYKMSTKIMKEMENEIKAALFDYAISGHGHHKFIDWRFPITDDLKEKMAKDGISIDKTASRNYVIEW